MYRSRTISKYNEGKELYNCHILFSPHHMIDSCNVLGKRIFQANKLVNEVDKSVSICEKEFMFLKGREADINDVGEGRKEAGVSEMWEAERALWRRRDFAGQTLTTFVQLDSFLLTL